MTVDIVGAAGGVSASTSGFSAEVAVDAGAAVGDLLIFTASNERGNSIVPTVTMPGGAVVVELALNYTNLATVTGWRRLTSGDIGQSVTAAVSTIRRISIASIVLRGGKDPVFGVASAVLSSATAHPTPTVTPAEADSLLVALAGLGLPLAPFIRTFSAAGWTEQVEAVTQNASAGNAASYLATKQLVGGVSSQAGATVAPSDTSSNVVSYLATAVVAPAPPATIPVGFYEARTFLKTA